MRPHESSAPWPYPPRRPHLPASERRGQRAATPPAQSARDRPGELLATLGGLFLGPVSATVPPWKCRHPAESLKEPARRTVPPPPRRAVLQPRFREESAPRHMPCAENRWTQSVRGIATPSRRAVPGSAWMSNSPPAVLGFSRTRSVPDSVTDIDRRRLVPIHRGADFAPARRFEQWRVQYSGSGSLVRRLAMPQEGPLTLLVDLEM